jgi:hypothetical protein
LVCVVTVATVHPASSTPGVHPHEHAGYHDPEPIGGKELDHVITPVDWG